MATLLLLRRFSRVRLRPPGSAVPGILQARTLEWGAIAFSEWRRRHRAKTCGHGGARRGWTESREELGSTRIITCKIGNTRDPAPQSTELPLEAREGKEGGEGVQEEGDTGVLVSDSW